MKNTSSTIKKQLLSSWDQMKVKYPVVVDKSAVKGDTVKEEFLQYIDGLRSVGEISQYLTLDASEAHLVFSNLLAIKAIRFIDHYERLTLLNRQNAELKNNQAFLAEENNKLKGEKYYLSRQIESKQKEMLTIAEVMPSLQERLQEFNREIDTLKSNSTELWDYNSDLLGLVKDMSIKEKQINEIFIEIEAALPKLIKKKKRMSELLSKADERVNDIDVKNIKIKRLLSLYHESVEEVRDYLFDAKTHLNYFKNDM
ncbi:MAG: hypothetical protein HQK50_09645 [Oligoflexia bacterium]|nr:hypothetical protein [Oligoflexia bacterium]MBF0365825.1 hypothetical protein [Oligoflexia bacterium]